MGNDAKRRVRDGTALALRLLQKADAANHIKPGQPVGEPIRLGSKPLFLFVGGLQLMGTAEWIGKRSDDDDDDYDAELEPTGISTGDQSITTNPPPPDASRRT